MPTQLGKCSIKLLRSLDFESATNQKTLLSCIIVKFVTLNQSPKSFLNIMLMNMVLHNLVYGFS